MNFAVYLDVHEFQSILFLLVILTKLVLTDVGGIQALF